MINISQYYYDKEKSQYYINTGYGERDSLEWWLVGAILSWCPSGYEH